MNMPIEPCIASVARPDGTAADKSFFCEWNNGSYACPSMGLFGYSTAEALYRGIRRKVAKQNKLVPCAKLSIITPQFPT